MISGSRNMTIDGIVHHFNFMKVVVLIKFKQFCAVLNRFFLGKASPMIKLYGV